MLSVTRHLSNEALLTTDPAHRTAAEESLPGVPHVGSPDPDPVLTGHEALHADKVQADSVDLFTLPAHEAVAAAPREAQAVRQDAIDICRKLLKPAGGPGLPLREVLRSLPADVATYFVDQRASLLEKMAQPLWNRPLQIAQIVALLIGEIVAMERAGAEAGVDVGGAASKVTATLDLILKEVNGNTISVVESDRKFVGETLHIMAAAHLRNETNPAISVKVAPAPSDAYSRRYYGLINGARRENMEPLVPSASSNVDIDIPKSELSAIMLGGDLRKIPELRGVLLQGLSEETIREINERTATLLQRTGMEPGSTKLGIVIRNVIPGAGGTQVPIGNLSRETFREMLAAANAAGIRQIVLLGDKPGADWLAGTPWDADSQASASRRTRRTAAPGAAAPESYRLADFTESWSATGGSPLFTQPDLGERRHISMTTAIGSGPDGENSLQGGYAEQLALYQSLYEQGMVGVAGNRSGVLDGPGFMGIPTVQLVKRTPFPKESRFDRLGLLTTVIPTYKVLSLESPQWANRNGGASAPPPNLTVGQMEELQATFAGFVERKNTAVPA